jgi:HAUS augmin-like complex subunit 7
MSSSSVKDLKLARTVKERLDQLACPYTENVEENWILELVFTPGESRIRLLQWLFSKFDSKLDDVLDPHNAPIDTKMDSRIQRMLFVASSLGLCGNEDADLIRGIKSGPRQLAFIDSLLDVACIVDAAETPQTMHGSARQNLSMTHRGNLAGQLSSTCKFVSAVSAQSATVDGILPSDIRLLPPDIVRQIELDSQQQQQRSHLSSSNADRSSQQPPDQSKLREDLDKVSRDLERQKEMLAEIARKHRLEDSVVEPKPTVKQTVRLSLSELGQLLTSFAYCYDNELRPWCGTNREPPSHRSALGPTLKRVHAPLEQFVGLLDNTKSIQASYRRLCAELHRDVSRLRHDIDQLAGQQSSKGDAVKSLCTTFHETVDVLEESILRTESLSSMPQQNLPIVPPVVKLQIT